jgi:hypothetical protein
MSPAAYLTLKYLALAEPLVTIGALLAWIRAGKRNSGMPKMRDYLAARSVATTVNISLLYIVLAHPRNYWLFTVYLYDYWADTFVQAWFMLRVLGDVLQQYLRSLPGLRTLTKVIFRWVLIAAVLLALPAAVAFAIVFIRARPIGPEVYTFFKVVAIAQVLPLSFVAILGMWIGSRPSGRNAGILTAFCLEPTWLFMMTWFHKPGVLVWTNLVNEIVCYAALGLWTWCAFHADREDQLPMPNPTLQHWDQLARRALRLRLPPDGEAEPAPQGARPQPRPTD